AQYQEGDRTSPVCRAAAPGHAARWRVLPHHGAAQGAPVAGVPDPPHLCVRCTATPAQPRCPPGCTGVAYPVRSTRPLPPHGRWVGAVAPGGSVAAARLSGLRTGHRGGATKRNIDTMAMTAREDTSSRMSGAIIAVRGISKVYPRPGGGRAPVLH